MTLAIELTPDEATRLRRAAQDAGLAADEWARRVLTDHLPPPAPGQATRDLLRAWGEEDATDDPEEVRKAEEELAEFKAAMNTARSESGERFLFP